MVPTVGRIVHVNYHEQLRPGIIVEVRDWHAEYLLDDNGDQVVDEDTGVPVITNIPACLIEVFGTDSRDGNDILEIAESDGSVVNTWFWPPRPDLEEKETEEEQAIE